MRHHGGLLATAVPYRKGASHDCSSTTNDGGYAGTEFVASYPGILSPTGFSVRTPLRKVAGCAGSRAHSHVSNLSDEREEAGCRFNTHRRCGTSLPLQDHPQAGMDLRGCASASQEAAETARRSEPGGSRTLPRMRCLSKTARNPDRLLRCRLACIGSCSAECRRNRQQADGHPGRPRQGPQGSVRNAIAEATGDFAGLLDGRTSEGVAVSGCSSRSADNERSRRRRLPKGTSILRPIQACHTAFATPRFCGTFARVWHRRPDHSAAAWSSQPGYHRQVLANSYEQGLRHVQPPGPAAASGSRGAEADTAKTLLSWGRWPAPGRKSRMCSAATAKPIVSVMAPRYALHSVAS